MKTSQKSVLFIALVAIVTGVAVSWRKAPDPTEAARVARNASSWTLFGGVGSMGGGQRPSEKRAQIDFSVPAVKEYEGGAIDLENLTVVQFVDKYRAAANAADTGAANAAYRIYQAEKMCADNRETESRLGIRRGNPADETLSTTVLGDEAEACVGVTLAMIYERVQFLRHAAQGGVEGAAMDFFREGQAGHGVGSWAADAIQFLQTAGKQGDINALHQLSVLYQGGQLVPPDPQKALTYKAAMILVQPDHPDLDSSPIIRHLSASLPPELSAAAIREGRAIAAQCCDQHATR